MRSGEGKQRQKLKRLTATKLARACELFSVSLAEASQRQKNVKVTNK